MSAAEHESFMQGALDVARRGWGATNPGPMGGALVVEDGRVMAEGSHAPDGGPHAERLALIALGHKPRANATLYATMEPCASEDRSGSCADAIIASGIKRVVIGAKDPDPTRAGKGVERLQAAQIEVYTGVLERECTDLNLIYNHWIAQGTPLIAAKSAITLDGRIACRSGESHGIVGEAAREDMMRWRRLFPSIAVGAGTVMTDNPQLTARMKGQAEWCPFRFIFDGLLRSVADRAMPRVYTDDFRDRTIVVTTPHGGMGYVRKLKELGVQVWTLPSATQRVPISEFRKRCAQERISGVYLEGGAHLISQIVQDRQMDYFFVYRAPILLADDRAKPVLSGLRTEKLMNAIRLEDVRHEVFGEDMLTRGRVAYPERMFIDETTFSLG
ncbi:MAG: riboflavin biosynthesis protein RibD [Verrucomicrobia bacterium]|nr:riboflavin biosynthesis protein RibD [Verrucomicrobiota bacterium]